MIPSLLPPEPSSQIKIGEELFGDSFDLDAVQQWHEMERNAFAEYLSENQAAEDAFPFYIARLERALRKHCAPTVRDALILGPGEGREAQTLLRIFPNVRLTLVEPSPELRRHLAIAFPTASIIAPSCIGRLPQQALSCDIAICMGVLHHIPNVSFVISEIGRVLRPPGFFYIREPCSAMGLWGRKRDSLTPNERGIARIWMVTTLKNCGFDLVKTPAPMGFDKLLKLVTLGLPKRLLGTKAFIAVDAAASTLLRLNDHYYRDSILKKIGPSSYEYLCRKRTSIDPQPV
jgi:SAM-dependent methyltransferase